ncbi:LOW QUALITY PROTEIN: hypothetical protein OSB04_018203 [Centaurea solstitialis]|uniref:Integrase catalytic domain-containing protein n=1 Tax=Centaurea solstitialis TaxID=347529 RepID=A0AA38T4D5_9ASTR|nr:LOW QUALITY PROTEIN: hypothetical protein OSB04_018203 [Centaurea solstitialis]
MDLCGPIRVQSINGRKYILVIVDDFSRYTWVNFLRRKDGTSEIIISFIRNVRLQLLVQMIHTDNGTEFKNHTLDSFLDSVGITHTFSAARTPQQNGVVERKNHTLVEAARTMLASNNSKFIHILVVLTDSDRLINLPYLSFWQKVWISSPLGPRVDWIIGSHNFALNRMTFTRPLDNQSLELTPELVEPFAEPEREFRKKNKKKNKSGKVLPRALKFDMGDEQPMWTARRTAPAVATQPITKPILKNEIKGQFLHMIKELAFDGKSDSNPIVHVENFIDICDLFRIENTTDDAILLRLFPFTLVGEAKA